MPEPKSLDYILGIAHGLVGEEVQVSWTRGYLHNSLTPQGLRGVLVDAEGVIRGVLELSFDVGDDLGNFAEIKVVKDGKVVNEVVEYRGAWLWPLEEIYNLLRPVERRGNHVPKARAPKAPRFRPRVKRKGAAK